MKISERMRRFPGVLLKDVLRFRKAFRCSGTGYESDVRGWISLCNRIERLESNPEGPGVRCDWKWGSDLVACEVLPFLGRQLMRKSLLEWPIRFSEMPQPSSDQPTVTFVIAHAGTDRLPQLRRTIRSLFAQAESAVEVIVIDQSPEPVTFSLPTGIRYHHLSKKGIPEGWYKSWAYNIGARLAKSEILVFQDGDICVPQAYAKEVVRTLTTDGYEVASLQRMLFYLNQASTSGVEAADTIEFAATPERVFQNWKGGTIAIRRDAFFRVGGFDEGFVDWGGEDTEFHDRCGALKHCRFGYLPYVHLWHNPQSGRRQPDNANITHVMPLRLQIPVQQRIHELSQRDFGNPQSPSPLQAYKASGRNGSSDLLYATR